MAHDPWDDLIYDHDTEWECDGCHKVYTLPAGHHYDTLADCTCPDFWGHMLVGGPAWEDYHNNGVHPMTGIFNAAQKAKATN